MHIWPVMGKNGATIVASNYLKMQVAPHSIVARTYGVVTNTIVVILESMIATLVSHPTQFICNYGKSNSGNSGNWHGYTYSNVVNALIS